MIDDKELRAFATQEVELVAIDYLGARYRPMRLLPGDHELVGREPPISVPSTHALGTATRGEFVINCRQPG